MVEPQLDDDAYQRESDGCERNHSVFAAFYLARVERKQQQRVGAAGNAADAEDQRVLDGALYPLVYRKMPPSLFHPFRVGWI